MSETEKPFTVSDRRHFTADGRPREETEPEASDAPPGETASPPPRESATPPPRESATPPPREQPPAELREPPPRGEGDAGVDPADFSQFLLSLGAQASILLTGQGLPEGADPEEALDGARSIISILEMLRDKTDGRRTKQEDEVIEGLLFELRMAYVEKSRAGGS
jgi:hypothetical protein